MSPEEVKQLIEAAIPQANVTVTGDGSHFESVVVSDDFSGKMPVKRQQMVYAAVTDQITSGALHALTIKAYTHEEWGKASKLQVGSS